MSHEVFNKTVWQKLVNDTLATCMPQDVDVPQQGIIDLTTTCTITIIFRVYMYLMAIDEGYKVEIYLININSVLQKIIFMILSLKIYNKRC